MSTLRSSNAEALQVALSALDLADEDAAAVQLARQYAAALDGGADQVKTGPPYLACLESLGMTPRARAAISGKKADSGAVLSNPLAELRERRRARLDPGSAVDASA